ncbi:hypothetical protein GJA_635 [Janthinobacterium agaricidamnosum NBRC 102515 = DSM 9628]|uniref:Uncharacterized protein n=1 Tax=Janthinobacterium agaricidamnosum NBRC 102515 = DSM 9628 TaxID=1349767 RepID=W0V0Z3_9BURK|nr:hypothetical protein GJA_635 [Janthinobacterium agaricidamnosum NBRC 102515 = DSM 9628]
MAIPCSSPAPVNISPSLPDYALCANPAYAALAAACLSA